MFRTRTRIGLYIDDAPGSAARAAAIIPHLRSQVTVISPADLHEVAFGKEVLVIRLPSGGGTDQLAAAPGERTVPPSLGSAGAAELVAWVEQESPDLLFVDGPPDVALFARLAGVRVVVLHRHGRRTAAQRQLMERAALGMIAPYPEDLAPFDEPSGSDTVYAGFLSRFADRTPLRSAARREVGLDGTDRLVTVMCGRDGLGMSAEVVAAAAAGTPGWRWHLLGRTEAAPSHDAAHHLGWVPDPWPHLLAADVVISGASPSVVAEVADAGTPLVVVPRRSGDREERRFADALGRVGAAVPLRDWPAPDRWAATLEAAARMDPRPLTSRRGGRAARRAAEWLDTWAAMPAADPDGPTDAEEIGLHLTSSRGSLKERSPEPNV